MNTLEELPGKNLYNAYLTEKLICLKLCSNFYVRKLLRVKNLGIFVMYSTYEKVYGLIPIHGKIQA
jgi:hypothetical protein